MDEISEYHDGSASAKLTEMYKRLETTKNRAESETILDSELLQSDVCQDFADIIEYHLKKAQQVSFHKFIYYHKQGMFCFPGRGAVWRGQESWGAQTMILCH